MARIGSPIPDDSLRIRRALWRVRMLHTVAWAVFAGSILAIPIVAVAGQHRVALWLSLLVWVEVIILAVNRMRCPLTWVAARYTEDRSANFDIFLPAWLARHNKLIFGSLFAADELLLFWHWAPAHAGTLEMFR